MRLYIGKNHEGEAASVQSIFRLAGSNEDALTFGLGFLLAHDPSFCTKVLRRCMDFPPRLLKDGYSVHLQEVTGVGFGRRDIVIQTPNMRVVLEAKIGDAEPTEEQLLKYASEHTLWCKYQRRAIVALTKVEIPETKTQSVRDALHKRNISFYAVQWHEIIDLVLRHKPTDNSQVSRYLFNEFTHYLTKDYEMDYYDAEILIQDVNMENANIYQKGWVYVTAPKDKKAPLYFAPYFTAGNAEPGIKYMSRVLYVRNVKLSDTEPVPDPPSAEHRQAWSEGLSRVAANWPRRMTSGTRKHDFSTWIRQ